MATFDIDEFLRAATQGEAAAAAPAPAAGSTPFYNKPISVPQGVKTLARKGLGVLGRATPAAAAITSVVPGAELLKSLSEAAANAYVGKPGVVATVDRGAAGFGAKPKPVAAPGAGAATPDLTPDQREAALEVGRIQAQREANAQLAMQPAYAPRTAVGGFYGAAMGLKQISGDNALNTSRSKLLLDAITKGAAARKDTAEADLLGVRGSEVARARAAGASPSEISAIASGRSTGPVFTGIPNLTGGVDVLQTRGAGAGAVRRVTPKADIAEADIQATMTANKMTREQVLARLRAEGRY